MVNFKQLSQALAEHKPAVPADEIRKALEELKIKVGLAERGLMIDEEDAAADVRVSPNYALSGFTSPDDFVVKETSIKYPDGGSYQGEMLGSFRHGQGTFFGPGGQKWSGTWKYDLIDGRASVVLANGDKYDGDWLQGRCHGRGKAVYHTGVCYEGDWENDARHGWGLLTLHNGDAYEGEMAENKFNGKGRYTHTDGSFFEGDWSDDAKVYGRFVAADGSAEYLGEWKDDKRNGKGVQYRERVDKYEGGWREDMQHGQGRCESADGAVYVGEWREGQRWGKGRYAMGNVRYNGEWVADKMHGKGTFLEENGDRYVGEFKDGLRHGPGRCLYADGTKFEGQWQEGKRWGKGTCVYANSDIYKGEWVRDQRHGVGFCRFADGVLFKGRWEDDGWVQSPADPRKCEVVGPGLTRAIVGRASSFLIQARDEQGNVRLNGGDEFQVLLVLHPEEDEPQGGGARAARAGSRDDTLTVAPQEPVLAPPPVTVTGEVTDKDDGTYQVSYEVTKAGVYELNILIGGAAHVAHSPYPVRALPGEPLPKRTVVRGAGRSRALIGAAAEFEILLHDAHGNQCGALAAQPPLKVYLQGSASETIPVNLQFVRNGRALCTYQAPSAAALLRLHVEWAGAALPGTPFSVQVATQEDVKTRAAAEKGSREKGPAAGAADADAIASELGGDGSGSSSQGPIRDSMAAWERIAAAAYGTDGVMDGWDSDEEERKRKASSEDAYLKTHPDVPVVENLEDLWMVSKLQRERKQKEESEKRKNLEGVRVRLEGEFGPGQAPTAAEAEAALRDILEEEKKGKWGGSSNNTKGELAIAAAAAAVPASPFTPSTAHSVAAAPSKRGGARRSRAELLAAAAALNELS